MWYISVIGVCVCVSACVCVCVYVCACVCVCIYRCACVHREFHARVYMCVYRRVCVPRVPCPIYLVSTVRNLIKIVMFVCVCTHICERVRVGTFVGTIHTPEHVSISMYTRSHTHPSLQVLMWTVWHEYQILLWLTSRKSDVSGV